MAINKLVFWALIAKILNNHKRIRFMQMTNLNRLKRIEPEPTC